MIKYQDFKKLKQLDRIEFLLEFKRIADLNDYNYGSSLANTFFLLAGFLLLVFLLMANLVGVEQALPFLYATVTILKIGIPVIVIGFLIDFFFWFRKYQWGKNLEKEFFKKEVKPRK